MSFPSAQRLALHACLLSLMALSAGCSSGPPGCSDGDVQEIVQKMLDEQAPVVALFMSRGGQATIAYSPRVRLALLREEYGEALTTLQETSKKAPGDDFGSRIIAAAFRSTAAISGVTTVSRSEHKTECELSVDFTLGVPSAEDERGVLGEKLKPEIETFLNYRQERTYETFHSDEGEVLVRLFPPD